MKIFAFSVFVVFPVSIFLFHVLTKKYLNPYKLIFVFGKKGSGKSTLLTKYGLDYQKKGYTVYSTEPIPGSYLITSNDIGITQFPPKSCIIIDEVGMIWDNRGFKNFPVHVRNYFKLQRHYQHVCILASQTFDVDKKIRDLSDEMYLVTKRFRVFSYAKKILRETVLVEATSQGESRIDENLVFDHLLLFWAGSRKFTYIPKYVKYFDSFVSPRLQDRDLVQVPLHVPIKTGRFSFGRLRVRVLRWRFVGIIKECVVEWRRKRKEDGKEG